MPSDIPEVKFKAGAYPPLDLLLKLNLVSSKAEAKRLIEQGGVEIDKKILGDWRKECGVKPGTIIRVGKRRFIKIR